MKAVAIAAVVGIVAFAGLFYFMQSPAKTTTPPDNVPLVSELPTSKKQAPRDEESPPPRSKAAPSTAKRPGNFPSIGDAPPAKPAAPLKTLHYTLELTSKRGPVPSRVFIRNASFGDLTIIVLGAEGADGRLFIRRGNYEHNKQQHPWEIRIVDGIIWVYLDGQEVPPATASF
jgi:hypothetical protein